MAALARHVRGLARQTGRLAPGQHRPHIQEVERTPEGRWRGWLALTVRKR
jgi:hypothetical protein